jgi:hypothetical protein
MSGIVVSPTATRLAFAKTSPQRAPEVSRKLPESRDSGANGNFGAHSRKWYEANMRTKSHN